MEVIYDNEIDKLLSIDSMDPLDLLQSINEITVMVWDRLKEILWENTWLNYIAEIIKEMIANSKDANAKKWRLRIAYEGNKREITITLWDNWDWIFAATTSQKKRNHIKYIWRFWIWLDKIKWLTGVREKKLWRFRFSRNSNWAIVSAKIKIDDIDDIIERDKFLELIFSMVEK